MIVPVYLPGFLPWSIWSKPSIISLLCLCSYGVFVEIQTLGDFLEWAEEAFTAADLHFGHGTDNAWDEAVALALAVLQLPPDADAAVTKQILSITEKERLMSLALKRMEVRMPVPYLTHEAWFAHLKFYVDERVIIPRSPMGELIRNEFEPWLGLRPVHRILDLCTGSACMAIAAAYAFPEAIIDAVDISEAALEVARINVKHHHCEDRVHLLKGDLFSECQENSYDIIISNPPYVDETDMESLPPEFLYEPRLALAAGADGLSVTRNILQDAKHYLVPQGLLFVELGNSAEALENAYPQLPFIWLDFEQGGEGVFLLSREDMLC